jgi:hypothetical protein
MLAFRQGSHAGDELITGHVRLWVGRGPRRKPMGSVTSPTPIPSGA